MDKLRPGMPITRMITRTPNRPCMVRILATCPCPCLLTLISLLELTVKKCLEALGEAEAAEASRGVVAPHETTASKFLAAGIDLQEQQYVLHCDLYG